MQITYTALVSNGLLAEGDIVSLSPGLELVDGYLVDRAVRARHRLHPALLPVLGRLTAGVSAAEFCASCRRQGLADTNIMEVIMVLNNMGALAIRRRWRDQVRTGLWRSLAALRGAPLPQLVRRTRATAVGFVVAVGRGLVPIFCLAALLAAFVWVDGSVRPATKIAGNLGIFCGGVWASAIVHEFGHWVGLGRARAGVALVRRGMRLGTLHRRLSRGTETTSSLLGPVAGAAAALILGRLLQQFFAQRAYGDVGCLLAVLHLCSLLPFYGDGAAIRKALSA